MAGMLDLLKQRRVDMKLRKDSDGTYELETSKGIFGFNAWNYSEPNDRPAIALFSDGHKVTELTGINAVNLYDMLTPDSDYEGDEQDEYSSLSEDY
jgi:hypothetical protein